MEIPATAANESRIETAVEPSTELASKLDKKAAALEAENIKSLLEQIEIHNRNLNHHETQKATMGLHTAVHRIWNSK